MKALAWVLSPQQVLSSAVMLHTSCCKCSSCIGCLLSQANLFCLHGSAFGVCYVSQWLACLIGAGRVYGMHQRNQLQHEGTCHITDLHPICCLEVCCGQGRLLTVGFRPARSGVTFMPLLVTSLGCVYCPKYTRGCFESVSWLLVYAGRKLVTTVDAGVCFVWMATFCPNCCHV